MDDDSTVEGSSCKIYALAVVERLPGKDQREERDLFDGRRVEESGIWNPKIQKKFNRALGTSRLSQIANPVSLRERESSTYLS